MQPARPIGPTIAEAAGFGALEQAQLRPAVQSTKKPGMAPESNFPAAYTPLDPFDTAYETKSRMLDGYFSDKPIQPFLQVGPDDVSYVVRKQHAQDQANFLRFCEQFINWGDPTHVALFKQWLPEFFEARENVIDNAHDISKRMAKITMRGVQGREDLEFLWLVQSGQIPVIGDLYKAETYNAPIDADSLKKAYFNPYKVVNKKQMAVPASPNYVYPFGGKTFDVAPSAQNSAFALMKGLGEAPGFNVGGLFPTTGLTLKPKLPN